MEYVSPISAPRIAYLRGLNDRCRRRCPSSWRGGSSIAAATSRHSTARLVSLPIRVSLRRPSRPLTGPRTETVCGYHVDGPGIASAKEGTSERSSMPAAEWRLSSLSSLSPFLTFVNASRAATPSETAKGEKPTLSVVRLSSERRL